MIEARTIDIFMTVGVAVGVVAAAIIVQIFAPVGQKAPFSGASKFPSIVLGCCIMAGVLLGALVEFLWNDALVMTHQGRTSMRARREHV